MSETSKMTPTRKRRPFASLGAKIMLILFAMGAVAAVLGGVSIYVFGRVNDDMAELTSARLVALDQSSQLITASANAKDAMISVLTADTRAGVDAGADHVDRAAAQLQATVAALPDDMLAQVGKDADKAGQMLVALVQARNVKIRNEAGIAAQLAQLQKRGAALQTAMTELADDANFELAISGESTLDAVDASLGTLVDEQFATVQAILQARGEINLLSGVLFSLQLSDDTATRSILLDLATAAAERLSSTTRALAQIEGARSYADTLAEANDLFAGFIADSGTSTARTRSTQRDTIIAARRDLDIRLSETIDDLSFELVIAVEETSSDNRSAIQGLLDGDVAQINTLFEIASWISKFQDAALNVVIAPGNAEARAAASELRTAAQALARYDGVSDGRLAQDLGEIASLADPDSGLLPYRLSVLDADAALSQAATAASVAVLGIGQVASELGLKSQAEIADMAGAIQSEIAQAHDWITWALAGLAVVFLGAFALVRRVVQRPLRRLRATTERLAEGDLSEVHGFERSSEEVYRIANALAIFRDGLLEKQDMTARQDAERQARMAEQNAVVSAIGNGLARLSHGDVTRPITEEMSGSYAKLRDDFNLAQDNLRDMLTEMTRASSGIRAGANQINTSSGDLSRRTENQAAALEQSVAALELVTKSVTSSADQARNVENSLQQAKTEAEQTGEVVRCSIDAMHEIKNGSDKISQIVSVIDDIAFQTNLLALNAGVEAARAGSIGSGFAVVAAEVRGLAQRSSESALEIKALIENNALQVNQGVEHVDQAGKALTAMLDRFNTVSGMVVEIATSSNEQAGSLKEVNTSMNELDRVTQENAAMVQDSTSATAQLNDDASKLAQLAESFQIDASPAPEIAATKDVTNLQDGDNSWGSAA